MSEFEQIMAKLNELSRMISARTNDNGATIHASQEEDELVSAKTLASMWEVKLRTIREWVMVSRTTGAATGIPFIQMPGSRLIRFPLKKVKVWYSRGASGRSRP